MLKSQYLLSYESQTSQIIKTDLAKIYERGWVKINVGKETESSRQGDYFVPFLYKIR
jgi:hypothetical protein